MPIYDFECDIKKGGCGHKFEALKNINDDTQNNECEKKECDKIADRRYSADIVHHFDGKGTSKIGYIFRDNGTRKSGEDPVFRNIRRNLKNDWNGDTRKDFMARWR